jgi:hypothetical protein
MAFDSKSAMRFSVIYESISPLNDSCKNLNKGFC